MSLLLSDILLLGLLLFLLFFLSVLDHTVGQLSRLTLKVMAEKETRSCRDLLEQLARDRGQFLLPVQFGIQLVLLTIAVLLTAEFLAGGIRYGAGWAFATLVLVVGLFRQLLPRLVGGTNPSRLLLRLLPLYRGPYRLLFWVSFPLIAVLRRFQSRSQKDAKEEEEEEATDEEIQAYLGVGEEEGIFEEAETRLIQSALEFGSTLVREIMTPRTEIVAIEEGATIAELKELIVSSKHSRIPVYRDRLDQVVGLVYVRNLLAYLDQGRGQEPITPLINEALLVPETKKVSELLKEMQMNAEHMAIVINEYGAVSGLVTIEDLLEEIVGEIRDEDELQQVDLIYEGNGAYIVRGNVEIEELEEALEVDLGEWDVTTVSGLVVAHLGKVPAPGDRVQVAGLQVEILSADRKKIHTMRIRNQASSEVRPESSDTAPLETPAEKS